MIGIIAMPKTRTKGSVYPENYVRWVEGGGSKAIVVPFGLSKEKLLQELDKVDGVVWVGGDIEGEQYSDEQYTSYMKTLYWCFQTALKYNDQGRYYPIWGTCSGFEILIFYGNGLTYKDDVFRNIQHHKIDHNRPIVFTDEDTRLKNCFPPSMRAKMAKKPCALHHHMLGFDVVKMRNIDVVSIDSSIINMIEFKHYPFYGVQFHPERPHSKLGEQVSQRMTEFLTKECSKN